MSHTLLALDPGGTSGWSFWRFSDTEPLAHVDHGMISGGNRGFIRWWDETNGGDPDIVVAEIFVDDHRTVSPDTTPLRIEGALDVLFPAWVGQRNVMKAHAPDSLLKEHDLWWPGAGHDRDSARHAIAYMKTIRHLPTLRAYWPPRREAA